LIEEAALHYSALIVGQAIEQLREQCLALRRFAGLGQFPFREQALGQSHGSSPSASNELRCYAQQPRR